MAGLEALLAMLLLAAGSACTAEASLPRIKGFASIVPEAAGEHASEQQRPLLLQRDEAVHFQVVSCPNPTYAS